MADRQAGAPGVLSYAEAVEVVERYARALAPCGVETVRLEDALGRVLAQPVEADRDQPPFVRSTRDGYACKASAAVGPMRVLGTVKAGERWAGAPLGQGEAVEIMTGAALPEGADCVVMVEHVERNGDTLRFAAGRRIAVGDNFVPAGAEARAGALLVPAAVRLGPAQVAAAASVGCAAVEVYRRPRAAVLSTGDELVGVEEQPGPQQIRNSNSYSLAAQVRAAGGEPRVQPIARDSSASLRERVGAVLDSGAEMLLLSGGVSAGKFDLVEEVLAELGARFFFTGVRIQPGKPAVLGEIPRRDGGGVMPVLGLPGNPVSTMVTFLLFAVPVLAALGGERGYRARFAEARLLGTLERKPGLRRFLPARLEADADGARVRAVPWQGSGDVAGTAGANCFAVVPEGEGSVPEGSTVRVLFA